MCELYDDGDRPSVWSEKWRTARKSHQCSCCSQPIAAGTRYLVHFHVYEGETTTEKMCAWCEAWRAEFAAAPGHYTPVPSDFEATLDSCIDEGDEESRRWEHALVALQARKREAGIPAAEAK